MNDDKNTDVAAVATTARARRAGATVRRPPKEGASQSTGKPEVIARAWAGTRGRITTPDAMSMSGKSLGGERRWRISELEVNAFDKIPLAELGDLLLDLSPEISREASNILRIANSGWELEAVTEDGRRVHPQGQAALDALIARLTDNYGSPDTVFNQYFLSLFMRGALVAELVLDKRGKMPVDLLAIDPLLVTFKEAEDPDRGKYWQLGQNTKTGQFRPLNFPTIAYSALDPFPGKPEGRPAAQSALYISVALMRTIRDLSRVIAQQGYPRLDIEVSLQKLAETLPEEAALDEETLQKWANAIIDEVKKVYASLEPDDAYIHSDVITVNRPVGAINTSSLGALDSVMNLLERMAIRALRTMPLLMASDEKVSQGNAARQWEIYVQGILALQHLVENTLSRLFTVSLQAQGITAKAIFRFAKVRATEEYRDVLTQAAKLELYIRAYTFGLVDLDEVSMEVFGKPAAHAEPLIPLVPTSPSSSSSDQETLDGEETQTQDEERGLTFNDLQEFSRLHSSINRLVDLYERDHRTAAGADNHDRNGFQNSRLDRLFFSSAA